MHSLAMACVGLVPRPIPEPGLENAGVVGRAEVRISGTMPRRRARATGNSYSPSPRCDMLPPAAAGGGTAAWPRFSPPSSLVHLRSLDRPPKFGKPSGWPFLEQNATIDASFTGLDLLNGRLFASYARD